MRTLDEGLRLKQQLIEEGVLLWREKQVRSRKPDAHQGFLPLAVPFRLLFSLIWTTFVCVLHPRPTFFNSLWEQNGLSRRFAGLIDE